MVIIRIINVHGTFDSEPARMGETRLKWWQGERQFSGQPVELPDRMEVPTSPFVEQIAKKFGGDEGRAVAEAFRWTGSYKEELRREAGMQLAAALKSAMAVEDDTYFILIGHSHGGTVIRYALQYLDIPRRDQDRILSWNTVGTPFLHFRRPFSLWTLTLNKLLAVFAALAFLAYVAGAFVDVRCGLQDLDDGMIKVPGRVCLAVDGIAPEATAKRHENTVSLSEAFDDTLADVNAEADVAVATSPATGAGLADGADMIESVEQEMMAQQLPSLVIDDEEDLSGYFDQPQNMVVENTAELEKERAEEEKAVLLEAFAEFRSGLILIGLILLIVIAFLVMTGEKANKALYDIRRTMRFRNVFLPKWNGFLHERDEAVVGLGLGAEKFSDKTQIIPHGALRPILFVIVLWMLFALVAGWEIMIEEGNPSGNPILSIIQGLQDLLTVRNKDLGFFASWLADNTPISEDVAALFDVPIEFTIGALVLVALSSLFVSFPWTNYIRAVGDSRIVRAIRAILLGTDDIPGETVFAVRYYPKGGPPAQATVLPEEIAKFQTERVNGAAPQTLEFIRKEIGLYGLNLGGDVPDLSTKVGQHFTWDELYHTTYFTVPEVRTYLIDEIAGRTPGHRSS